MKAKPLSDVAVTTARRVLDEARVESPRDIHVEAIAARHGAWVVYGPMATARASIVRSGRRAIVWVDERTRGAPWARFTVAHELGHHLLHSESDHFELCTGEERRGSSFKLEREANQFSTELLMPEAFATGVASRTPRPTLDDVEHFARTFRTSLLASALRYVQLTTAPCAVVMSEEGKIKWASESASFPGRVVQRRALHKESRAAQPHLRDVRDGGDPVEVNGAAWGATRAVMEQSILLSSVPGAEAVGAVGAAPASAVLSWLVG